MQKLFGSLLLGCGIIVAGLSGLCTLLFAGTSMLGSTSLTEFTSILTSALLAGGIPIGIGAGMFFGGRAMLRAAKRDEPPQF